MTCLLWHDVDCRPAANTRSPVHLAVFCQRQQLLGGHWHIDLGVAEQPLANDDVRLNRLASVNMKVKRLQPQFMGM